MEVSEVADLDKDFIVRYAREIGLEWLESAIEPGALATSETLNRFRRNVEEAVQQMTSQFRQYEASNQQSSGWVASMATWLLNQINSTIDAYNTLSSGWQYRFADPFITRGWTTSSPSMQNLTFGQITPPVDDSTMVMNSKRKVYFSAYNSLPTPHDGGDMEFDLTGMLEDANWNYPVPLPDMGRQYLWLYMPLIESSLLPNNLEFAVMPGGSVYVRYVYVRTSSGWVQVINGHSNLMAGRFWWDVRSTGRVTAVGVSLIRSNLSMRTALVRMVPYSTRFQESGVAEFDTRAGFLDSSFSVKSYTLHPSFPGSPSMTASLSGSGNSVVRVVINRLTPYVPSVLSGIRVEKL